MKEQMQQLLFSLPHGNTLAEVHIYAQKSQYAQSVYAQKSAQWCQRQ